MCDFAPAGCAADNMMSMMETMLRNPEMQKMMYPHLPEHMRNPSSIEWMLNDPAMKKQMAQMFESQASPLFTHTFQHL